MSKDTNSTSGSSPCCPSARFFCSSLGLKFTMAVTGVAMLGFVIAHLVGNLQFFLGADAINDYAKFLKSLGGLLWAARIGLLAMFVLHIVTAVKLRKINSAARPQPYFFQNTVQASAASRYMFETGMVILCFVLVHLAHFTFGVLQRGTPAIEAAWQSHDVYHVAVMGFQNPGYAGFYIVCMLLLGVHLSHGIASFFQTLGWNTKYQSIIRKLGPAIAWGIALGYISIPVSVLAGIIR